jgi:KDO2-lipid IV(A) lauroyltransferase
VTPAAPGDLPWSRWADALAYGAFRTVEAALRSLPPAAALGLARALGLGWHLADRRRRRRAAENLRLALGPAASPSAERARLRAAFRAMALVPCEVVLAERLLRGGALRRRCRLLGDWAALEADRDAGRPALVVTGHLGNWEVGARALAGVHPGTRVVVRPLDVDRLEARATGLRGGARRVLAKRGAVGGALRAMREGDCVALVADQDAGRRGVFVPFFGVPASTSPAPAVLALRGGASLYLGACLRREGRFAFDVHLERIPLPADGPREATALTRTLAEALERWVRRAPDQYNWLHRRWKTRPPDEAPTARVPSYARRPAV